jgi:hypothetical protein
MFLSTSVYDHLFRHLLGRGRAEVAQKPRNRHAVLELDLWRLDIRTRHYQESSDYGIIGSLDETAETGF